MKKVVFNPYAKTKTTTSKDCDEYDVFCTVLSDIEYRAIQEFVSARSANTFADTMNHHGFQRYYSLRSTNKLLFIILIFV